MLGGLLLLLLLQRRIRMQSKVSSGQTAENMILAKRTKAYMLPIAAVFHSSSLEPQNASLKPSTFSQCLGASRT